MSTKVLASPDTLIRPTNTSSTEQMQYQPQYEATTRSHEIGIAANTNPDSNVGTDEYGRPSFF